MGAGDGDVTEQDAIYFENVAAFEAWLEENAESSNGIWIRMAKKSSGIPSLDWKQGVEAALCFGWIDSQSKSLDGDWYIQRFTPRRARSMWSKTNCDKVEALVAAGRMRPRGLAEVEQAKADGRWDAAYDAMSTSAVPVDLADALQAAGVRAAFDGLDSRNRYAILHQIQTAKRPETRARRIAKYVDMVVGGDKPYP